MNVRQKPSRGRIRVGALVLVLLFSTACGAAGDEEEATGDVGEFFAGEDMSIIITVDPGGGFDFYAQLLADVLSKHLDATVSVEHRTGAGGDVGGNIFHEQAGDPRVMFFTRAASALIPSLAGAEGVDYDATEWRPLARVAAEPAVVGVNADLGIKTLEDLQQAEDFRFGSTGAGSSPWINTQILNEVLSMDAEVITGFDGSSEVQAAVLRGDIDGQIGSMDSQIGPVRAGEMVNVASLGGIPENAPYPEQIQELTDLDLEPEKEAMFNAHDSFIQMGRMVWAPPDTPDRYVTFLREALDEVINGEEFQRRAEAEDRPVKFGHGDEMQELQERAVENATEAYLDIVSVTTDEN